MNSSTFLARHARAIVIVAFALALAGLASAFTLPVGLFPQVSFPRVVVDLDAGDRPADQTSLLLTRPVEEAIRTVPGVAGLRSETTRGSAQISIDFGWGRDMVASTLLVDSAIARVLPSLPPGATYNVRRMDPTVFPIISYALQSDTLSPVALRDLAQYQIVPLLASVEGLARVDVQGGETAELQVEADPRKLAQYGLSLDDLSNALAGANQLQAVGRLQDRNKLYLVVADHSLKRIEAIRQVMLKNDPHGWVRLGDVASVRDGYVPQWIRVSEDGRDAVLFNVYQQPGGNTVQIARQVRGSWRRSACPLASSSRSWYDQSELIVESANSVRDAVLIGAGARRRRAAGVPAQHARHADRRAGRAGALAVTVLLLQAAWAELQHHDAGRHGGGGRPDHRRRHRDDRAHRAAAGAEADAAVRHDRAARRRASSCGRCRAQSCRDDRDLHPAGLPLRRHRARSSRRCR